MNPNQTQKPSIMPIDPYRMEPIWMDLWDYIQECQCDDTGMNYPFGREGLTPWGLQVYTNSGRHQVNVCHKDIHDIYNSVMNFVFEDVVDGKPEMVWIIPVNRKGVADYDSDYRLRTSEYISGEHSTDWYSLSYKGSVVKEVFRDLLIPRLPGNNKKGE